jgi:Tfp pilus assembly protein PilF
VAERRAVRAEGLLLFLNRGFCSLKKGDFSAAKRDADCALGIDPLNVKGRFRRGAALLALER